jgi:hypothetical protein
LLKRNKHLRKNRGLCMTFLYLPLPHLRCSIGELYRCQSHLALPKTAELCRTR